MIKSLDLPASTLISRLTSLRGDIRAEAYKILSQYERQPPAASRRSAAVR